VSFIRGERNIIMTTDDVDLPGHEEDDPSVPSEGGPVEYPAGPQDDEAGED